MAINFPDSPSNNDTYTDPVNGNRYIYDSANSAWKSASTFQYSVTISSTAPGSPQQGTLWWNQDYGRLLVYYQDANTSQWVDAAPADDKTVIFGVANAAFGVANNALANTSGVSFNGDFNVSNGNIGIGTNSPAFKLDIYDNTSAYIRLYGNTTVAQQMYRYSSDTLSAQLQFLKLRGSVGASTIVLNNDITGRLNFYGYDGSNNLQTAEIRSVVDGLAATGSMPGRLLFYTTANGASSVTERMRIDSSGNTGIGITSPLSRLHVNGSFRLQAPTVPFEWTANPGANDYLKLNAVGYTDNIMGINSSGAVGVGLLPTVRNNTSLQIKDGIGFPATQVASSDANTLDDYEEGTWTPTYIGSTTNPTVSYTAQSGKYTKIGNLVICHVYVRGTLTGGSGNIYIGGLPFTVATGSGYGMYGNRVTSWAWSGGSVVQSVNPTDSTNYAVLWDAGTNIIPVSNAGGVVLGTFYYYTT